MSWPSEQTRCHQNALIALLSSTANMQEREPVMHTLFACENRNPTTQGVIWEDGQQLCLMLMSQSHLQLAELGAKCRCDRDISTCQETNKDACEKAHEDWNAFRTEAVEADSDNEIEDQECKEMEAKPGMPDSDEEEEGDHEEEDDDDSDSLFSNSSDEQPNWSVLGKMNEPRTGGEV